MVRYRNSRCVYRAVGFKKDIIKIVKESPYIYVEVYM